jgi:hypothetical protein
VPQGRSQYQDYLNFILEAGSRAEEVIDVPKDTPDIIRAGSDFSDLVARPGWTRLLDKMEARANGCLAALRNCQSNDPRVVTGLRDRWREAEESLKFVQITAGEAIEQRRVILEELEQRFGGLEVDSSEQRIQDFMNANNLNGQLLTGEDEL